MEDEGWFLGFVEIGFGIVYGQISSIFDRDPACHMIVAGYYHFMFSLKKNKQNKQTNNNIKATRPSEVPVT